MGGELLANDWWELGERKWYMLGGREEPGLISIGVVWRVLGVWSRVVHAGGRRVGVETRL